MRELMSVSYGGGGVFGICNSTCGGEGLGSKHAPQDGQV